MQQKTRHRTAFFRRCIFLETKAQRNECIVHPSLVSLSKLQPSTPAAASYVAFALLATAPLVSPGHKARSSDVHRGDGISFRWLAIGFSQIVGVGITGASIQVKCIVLGREVVHTVLELRSACDRTDGRTDRRDVVASAYLKRAERTGNRQHCRKRTLRLAAPSRLLFFKAEDMRLYAVSQIDVLCVF